MTAGGGRSQTPIEARFTRATAPLLVRSCLVLLDFIHFFSPSAVRT